MRNDWPVIGHKKIIDFLRKSIKNDKLAHAYLFYGPNKVGKFRTSLEFAKILECKNGKQNGYIPCGKCQSCARIENLCHPDVLIVKAEKIKRDKKSYEKKIGVEEVRRIRHHLSLFSHSGAYKIVIVDGVEKLSREASNAFLKTLEEPAGKSIIILITDTIGEIIPTIISRTQIIKFLPVSNNEMAKAVRELNMGQKENFIKIDELINFSSGKPGLLIDILKDSSVYFQTQKTIEKLTEIMEADICARYGYIAKISQNMPEARDAVNCLMIFFRDMLLLKENCDQFIVFRKNADALKKFAPRYTASQIRSVLLKIKESYGMLLNSSFNAKLILEVLFLKI